MAPTTDTAMRAMIQAVIADGWIARSLIEDRILVVLDIDEDAQAEEARAQINRLLDESDMLEARVA